jgi:dihydrofolate synthase/folylpolyglutamate synthase
MIKHHRFTKIEEAKSYLLNFYGVTAEQRKVNVWERTEYLMSLIDNPQNKLNIVHVAGTSGKGSVTSMIAEILSASGLKVGSTVSPHILDLRERIKINGQFISEEQFIKCVNDMYKVLGLMERSKFGRPSFFEIMIAIAYKFFYEAKVDYVVVETGLGGLLDATNTATAKNKIAVITKIGFDHQEVLGKTLKEITAQKAGIIHQNNTVFCLNNHHSVNKILKETCLKKNAYIEILKTREVLKSVQKFPHRIEYTFNGRKLKNINVSLQTSALYQVENSYLSLTVAEYILIKLNLQPDAQVFKRAIQKTYIPGRFEIRQENNKSVIFDGAHNPQKMQALIDSLKYLFPNQKFDFVLAFKSKSDNDFKKMLNIITPLASTIFATRFDLNDQGIYIPTRDPQHIVEYFYSKKEQGPQILKEKNALKAYDIAVKDGKENFLVVTGSLYLVSQILKYKSNFKEKLPSRNV